MNPIYFSLVILGLTAIGWLALRQRPAICPICIAVILTWAGGLLASYLGYSWANPLVVGLLMGASLGAISNRFGPHLGLGWQTGLIALGLPTIYWLVTGQWGQGWLGLGVMVVATWWWAQTRPSSTRKQSKDLFDDCC